MSLQPQAIPPIPEETARVARALFPKGNRYMQLRDELGTISTDEQCAALYAEGGHLVSSQNTYGVELLGPVTTSPSWQSRAGQGFDHAGFTIDWQARQATCPQGNVSGKWTRHPGSHGLRGDWHPIWQTGLFGVSVPQPM